jgi:hypothetical protein
VLFLWLSFLGPVDIELYGFYFVLFELVRRGDPQGTALHFGIDFAGEEKKKSKRVSRKFIFLLLDCLLVTEPA